MEGRETRAGQYIELIQYIESSTYVSSLATPWMTGWQYPRYI